jgi:hypothetical protein
MTATYRPRHSEPSGGVRSLLLRLGSGLLAGGCWLSATLAGAGPDAIFSPTSAVGAFDQGDCRRTLLCRQALQEDEVLAPLNVGVSTRGGIATLWGLVPSADLVQRAADRVLRVPGIVEVRNELHIAPPQGTLKDLLSNPEKHRAAALAQPPSTGHLTGLDHGGGVLLAVPAPTVTAPAAAGRAAPWLIEEVEQLRRQDPRFRFVQPTVTGRVVRLSGQVACKKDLFDLAQAVARLPRVERVVIDQVRTQPDPPVDLRIR